ncbi:MAG: hypothetical protein ACO0C9_03605 [Candidatus Methanosuratincola verstraetei]
MIRRRPPVRANVQKEAPKRLSGSAEGVAGSGVGRPGRALGREKMRVFLSPRCDVPRPRADSGRQAAPKHRNGKKCRARQQESRCFPDCVGTAAGCALQRS